MDSYLIAGLMAWLSYWMYVAVFSVGRVAAPITSGEFAAIAAALAVIPLINVVRRLLDRDIKAGDHVIYRMQKFSNHPGPRAENIKPVAHGEGYRYSVRKLWTVIDVHDDEVEVVTPGGKHLTVEASDPRLRRAGWLSTMVMWLKYHKTFPSVEDAVAA